MPPFGVIKRRDLIRYLRKLGFSEPIPGGRHQQMEKGDITVIVPNPHRSDISKGLLAKILEQAGISRAEWEQL